MSKYIEDKKGNRFLFTNTDSHQIALNCYRAISDNVATMELKVKSEEMISAELLNVISDCIYADPERMVPIVEWVTERNRNLAKRYNDSVKQAS